MSQAWDALVQFVVEAVDSQSLLDFPDEKQHDVIAHDIERYKNAFRAEVLHDAAEVVGARCEEHGVFGLGDLLRRMADGGGS